MRFLPLILAPWVCMGQMVVDPYNSFPESGSTLLNDLSAYWDLDETSGTRYDSTENNNDLTEATVVGYATGIQGNAADFEESDSDYMYALTETSLEMNSTSQDFSISMWVKMESQNNYTGFLGKGDWTSSSWPDYAYQCMARPTVPRIQFSIGDGTSSQGWLAPADSLPNGEWHHIVFVGDAANDTMYIYLDAGTPSSNTGWTTSTYVETTYDFRMGMARPSQYMDGLIDEVGFWKRVLTSAEISALYNGGSGITYPFD